MPDIITIILRRWKFIFSLTLAATVIAYAVALIAPKKYLSVATALPANGNLSDKARMFNPNIESLYSEFGSTDELDKIEGAASLDTIFIATISELGLVARYGIDKSGDSLHKAVKQLRQNTDINKSPYGELKVKVWDKDRNIAASISNTLLQKIQDLYQNLQSENNLFVLKKMKEDLDVKQQQYNAIGDSLKNLPGRQQELLMLKGAVLSDQIKDRMKMIDEYEMAVKSNPPVLLTVEKARPSPWPDKPRVLQTVGFTFFSAFIFAFLLSLFIESRKQ